MACPITICKFVGTISLGLLTGLSYTTSSITIPALQSLPNASSAARALKEIQLRTRKHVLSLAHVTAFSLITAFTLSSPRRKHPYLIWTGLVALVGGTGLECWFNGISSWGCMSSVCCGFGGISGCGFGFGFGSSIATRFNKKNETKADDEESNGNASEIEIVENTDVESSANVATPPSTVTPAEELDVNGESVEKEMEQERKLQQIRSWILGLGFSMGVVGIWGDRA